jgi:tRNA(Ile)-lysidine synthase
VESEPFEALQRAVRRMLAAHGEAGQAFVAAVSGGVDSMVLLHLALRAAGELGMTVRAVHVHHGLRDKADDDADFVTQIGAKWGVPVEVRRVDLTTLPPAERRGTEADARRLRYGALCEAAEASGARAVLLAHHADDQLETMLWRLIRGTSVRGLSGIRPVTERWGIRWLRPLLEFEKSTLVAYAKAHEIPWVEDETNRDPSLLRNAIRLRVVPELRRLQPAAALAASRLARVLQDEDAWLEAEAERWVQTYAVWDASRRTWRVPTDRLVEAPRALQRRTVTLLLYCLASTEWTFAHVEAILELAQAGGPSARLSLPAGLAAWRVYGDLFLGPGGAEEEAEARDGERRPPIVPWRLEDSAVCTWPASERAEWEFVCRMWVRDAGCPPNLDRQTGAWVLWLPETVTSLTLRTVQPGDRIEPLGMNGTKKLQDVFVDRKVPRHLRAQWPVVCHPDGPILWVPGLVRSRRALVEQTDARGWRIEARRRPGHGQAPAGVS